MYCRNCSNQVDDRAVACPKCGVAPRDGTAFCPGCGKSTVANAIMCPNCGVSLAKTGSNPRASNKVLAGIMGILFGALGVHKFILGYTKEGVIMLAVSLVTCGFGAIAMGPIGLVEGIIYLTKSDDEFVKTYVDAKRGWF